MRKYPHLFFVLLVGIFSASCKKVEQRTDICLHDSSIDYMKRWSIREATTAVYDANDKLIVKTNVTHNGYFQINSDYTYTIFSDGAPIDGRWNINKNCEFVLNPNTAKERNFSVIKLSDDSLILRQTSGHTVITERFAAFKCPSLGSLQARWDNAYTLQSPYGIDTVYKTELVRQEGYFRMNPDASYNVFTAGTVSGTPPPPPITGTWGITQPGCLLVLDKNKTNERSYEVQKVNADSLVIWRKDTVRKLNLLRYYSKHK